jgi:hypothetical protein
MAEALDFGKLQRAKGRPPHLSMGMDIQAFVKANPGGFCQFNVAIEVGLVTIFLNQALVARFYAAKKAIAFSSKNHGAMITALDAVGSNGFENVEVSPGPGIKQRIVEAVVFDIDAIAVIDQAMYTLTVGPPQVVVVHLFRIKSDAIKKLEGQWTKEDMDVSVVFGIFVSLLSVAKMTRHPTGQGG